MVENCRFCSIKLDIYNPKVNNLSAQLIEYQYLDEFYFYFAKSINEIITHSKSSDTIYYRDVIKDNPWKEYFQKKFTKEQAHKIIKSKINEYPNRNPN